LILTDGLKIVVAVLLLISSIQHLFYFYTQREGQFINYNLITSANSHQI